jgi:uncharacterized membrane protein HdeD (DUF308 family)
VFSSRSSSLLWRGVLALVIGLVAVAWPNTTVGAFVILFAIYALMMAGTDLARAFSGDRAGTVFGYLLLALLSLAAGLGALLWPGITTFVLTVWVAAWSFLIGCVEVVLAFGRGETARERAAWAFGGFVSIALGVVLGLRPDTGALALATAFGLFSLVYGAYALVLSAQVSRGDIDVERLGTDDSTAWQKDSS